jgi:hypothetical protein
MGDGPFWDSRMLYNAAPFVVVTLLSLGQLAGGIGGWISSAAMILIGAAAAIVALLGASSSWILVLTIVSMVGVAWTAWYGDAAIRGAGSSEAQSECSG